MGDARQQQAQHTRSQILDAAEHSFAEVGYTATSMRAVAEASGVSQALIHHHFGTKKGLHDAVRTRALSRYARARAEMEAGAPDSPSAFLVGLRGLFYFFRDNPALQRLGDWDRLRGDPSPWEGEPELLQVARAELAGGQQAGLLRADVDPLVMMVFLSGATLHWLSMRERCATVFSLDDLHAWDDRYIEQTIRMLVAAVGTEALAALPPHPATPAAQPG